MTLRHRTGEPAPPLSGERPWGQVTESGRTATVVRFLLRGRTISFPVDSLKYWEFDQGPPEKLIIHTEPGALTLHGTGLSVVRDHLDESRLAAVRVQADFGAPRPNATFVTRIEFVPETRSGKAKD